MKPRELKIRERLLIHPKINDVLKMNHEQLRNFAFENSFNTSQATMNSFYKNVTDLRIKGISSDEIIKVKELVKLNDEEKLRLQLEDQRNLEDSIRTGDVKLYKIPSNSQMAHRHKQIILQAVGQFQFQFKRFDEQLEDSTIQPYLQFYLTASELRKVKKALKQLDIAIWEYRMTSDRQWFELK